MTKMLEVYKCGVCGNITMVVSPSSGTLACCGKPMIKQDEKTEDAGKEKHVPVVEKGAGSLTVKLGSIPHPMEEKHYIQWIEVTSGDRLMVQGLKSGQKPEAQFPAAFASGKARAYCNIHGLWKSAF
jgi:superoxide reductase